MSTYPHHLQPELFARPKQIVVATDLTDCDRLLPHIVAQAGDGTHVTLVHAILPANLLSTEYGDLHTQEQDRLERNITGMVIDFGARLRDLGVHCDVVAEHGFASDVLRRQIEATEATRLIMATHGRGLLGRLALGSVAAELLRSIAIPIFAVGPQAALETGTHSQPKRILHPVSLTGDYVANTAFALDLASCCGAELTLLHVLAPEDFDGPLSARTENARHAMLDLLPNRAVPPEVHAFVHCGERIEMILECAARIKADWIVVGMNPQVPFWPFHETTAYQLMTHSSYPVLTSGHNIGKAASDISVLEEAHAGVPTRKFS